MVTGAVDVCVSAGCGDFVVVASALWPGAGRPG